MFRRAIVGTQLLEVVGDNWGLETFEFGTLYCSHLRGLSGG